MYYIHDYTLINSINVFMPMRQLTHVYFKKFLHDYYQGHLMLRVNI